MPELPEVETTRRGIAPHVIGRRITGSIVHDARLRWPVPPEVGKLQDDIIRNVSRRAKYILIGLDSGATLIVHLGMSGSLRICRQGTEKRPHDHIRVFLDTGASLVYHDPRRFGCCLWTDANPLEHPLLKRLGPEPLENGFTSRYLEASLKNRSASIKQALMDNVVVVGVGNIYACEALFLSGIHPLRKASGIGCGRLARLVDCIRQVLQRSIDQGGTTLRDFVREDGQPGYFKQQLMVYDREGKPCRQCGRMVRRITIGQRSTFYCTGCQH